jgi:hypothetical protein
MLIEPLRLEQFFVFIPQHQRLLEHGLDFSSGEFLLLLLGPRAANALAGRTATLSADRVGLLINKMGNHTARQFSLLTIIDQDCAP